MEAPIPLQAPVPRSHLFRSHSSYSNDMYSVRTASRDMLSQPPRPYLGQHGSDNFDSKAPSSDRTHIDLARQQAGLCRPILHPVHSMAQQAASRSYEPPRQESRVSVNNLLDSASPSLRSRHITTTRDSPPSHSSSAPISPRNTHSTPSDGRLPGVSQLLEGVMDGYRSDLREHRTDNNSGHQQREVAEPHPQWTGAQTVHSRPDRQDLPSLTTASNHQGHHPGHSAGSSLSSAFSEPTSPRSYSGQSYSPTPNQHYQERAPHEARGRAASHLSYQHRDDPALPYGPIHHQRSHTLPSVHPHPPPQPPYAHYAPSGTIPQYAPDPFGPLPIPMAQQQPLPHYPPVGPVGYPYDQRQRIDSAIPYDQYNHPPSQFFGAGPVNAFTQRKRRGNLPKEATKIMKDWFHEHTDSPYPTEEEKQVLCDRTKLQMSQVNNWFINARRRTPRKEAEKKLDRERGVTETSDDSMNNSEMTSVFRHLQQEPLRLQYP